MRQIRPVLRVFVTWRCKDISPGVVQAFISSRLDYCNSVLYGVTDNLLQRLQSVQNAAARWITRTGSREHIISPVLQELHWLPVRRTSNRQHSCSTLSLYFYLLLFSCVLTTHNKLLWWWWWSWSRCTVGHARLICQMHASWRLRPVVVSARLAIACIIRWTRTLSGWQVVWCRRTAALESTTNFTAVNWQSHPVQETVEKVLVCQELQCRLRRLVTLAFRRRI